MCGEPVTVASLDQDRFVAHCSCGCLHLVWRQLTLRMHTADVPKVIAQLTPMLEQQAGNSVHVWLGIVGLHLRHTEFEELMALLRQTQTALVALPPRPLTARQQDILRLPN
jgi:hypothetical protein